MGLLGATSRVVHNLLQYCGPLVGLMRGSRGETGDPEPPPPPLENHNHIVFLSNAGPDSYQASIQSCAIIGTPFKRRFTGGPMLSRF